MSNTTNDVPSTVKNGVTLTRLSIPEPQSTENEQTTAHPSGQVAASTTDPRQFKSALFHTTFNPQTDFGAFAAVSNSLDFANRAMEHFIVPRPDGDGKESLWYPFQTYRNDQKGARTFCDYTLLRAQSDQLTPIAVGTEGDTLKELWTDCLNAEIRAYRDIWDGQYKSEEDGTKKQSKLRPQREIDFVSAFEKTFGHPESIIEGHKTKDEELRQIFTEAKKHIKYFRDIISEGRTRWEQACNEWDMHEALQSLQKPGFRHKGIVHTHDDDEEGSWEVDTSHQSEDKPSTLKPSSDKLASEERLGDAPRPLEDGTGKSVAWSIGSMVLRSALTAGMTLAAKSVWDHRASIASTLGWTERD